MILCLGTTPAVQRSMTFDRLQVDEVNRTAAVHTYASGKSINAARVLHTLGQEVLCTGLVGGEGGTLIRRDLDAVGIAHEFVEVQPGTRTCTTVIDRATASATELVEESAPVDPSEFDRLLTLLADLIAKHTGEAQGLLLSGSLPPGAPDDFYARAVDLGREAGLLTLLDAKGPPLLQALPHKPTVVKPNRTELSQTVGRPLETDELLHAAVGELLSLGPAAAVITGGKGVTFVSDGQHLWQIAAPTVPVVSAIGSGDSFAAGLMAGLVEGKPLDQAARLAVACGSANAMTADAGHVNRDEVGRLFNQITSRPVDSACR